MNGRKRILMVASAGAMALLPALAQAQTVQSISQADREQGAKAHPQLVEEFGGAMTGSQATYVESVGKGIAVQSGLSNAKSDFTVTLLNSPVNNAFAIPGGYIYVTRDLVGLMNNEAELAGVLGHEVGHVAARHAAGRQKAATRNTVIGVLGSVLAGAVLGNSGLGSVVQKGLLQGSQLLTLKYSRGQETQADNLGIDYLKRAGYDPKAMGTVLQSLSNENALEARIQGQSATKVPEWASTHPSDGPRVKAALARAGTATGVTNRDKFLAGIDGLMMGDDPKQGVVEGRKFTHPEFRFAFEAPQGFYMVNGTRAVAISGQSAKAELSSGAYSGNMDSYIQSVFNAAAGQAQTVDAGTIQRTTVNGLPAAYAAARVNSSGNQVDVLVFAYEFSNNQAFHFLTISQPGGARVFEPMFNSMRRISATEAAAVKPRKLDVVTVKKGDTLQSLASRMAYTTYQLDRFLVLNGLTSTSQLVPGQKVKVVVY
ncbi:MAG: M48 family metalloprotease [Novosphingobium sp.]